MPEKAGQINQYVCEVCGFALTTVNKDDGTTPAFLSHEHSRPMTLADIDTCIGTLCSTWYRVPEGVKPTHEWYSPAPKELTKLDADCREYAEMGGLSLREIEKVDPVGPELREQLVDKLRDWLEIEGRTFFREVDGEFGTVAATLPVDHALNEMSIPWPIHFREGMKVRNFLREAITLDLPDAWYDDSWAGLVEEAIQEDEEVPDVLYDADVIHHPPDPDVNTRWVKGADDE